MQSTFLLFRPGAALELGAYFMRLSCFHSLVPNRHEFVQFGHLAHCQRILHIMAIEQRRVRKNLKFYAMPRHSSHIRKKIITPITFLGQRPEKKGQNIIKGRQCEFLFRELLLNKFK